MSAPYDKIIEILTESAKEKNIPAELIKKIYDLERGETHLIRRDNEISLRREITEFFNKEKK